MKLGIYGGTFNPIHYGHLRTAEEIYETLSLDRILFVPAGRTPFDKPDTEKAADRYEMVKAAIRGNKHFRLSDIEIRAGSKAFTVDTIGKLRNRHEEDEFYFILGIDAFLDLHLWKQPDKLLKLTNMVVISRPGYTFTDLASSPYIMNVPVRILRELDKGKRTEYHFNVSDKQKVYLCRVTGLNISASQIRDLIRSGGNIKYLLPESVKSYIISNKLYVRNG